MLYFALNIAFYAMEMKHTITGTLVMTGAVDEISAVEFELFQTIVLLLLCYLGLSGL